MNTEYVIAGHSHIFAMGAAPGYDGPPVLMKASDGLGYYVMEQWNGNRSTAYWEKLIEASSGRDVLLVFNGNQHHGAFLFAPEPLFDFFDETTPELLDGATLVPRRLIEAFFDPTLDQLRLLVPRILAAGGRSVRLVGTPPPKSDIQIFADMIREAEFAKTFALRNSIDLARAKITPALLLLKLWRVVQDLTAKIATNERVAFVAVPSEALNAKGFLAKRFYDYVPSHITHANNEFGLLMT